MARRSETAADRIPADRTGEEKVVPKDEHPNDGATAVGSSQTAPTAVMSGEIKVSGRTPAGQLASEPRDKWQEDTRPRDWSDEPEEIPVEPEPEDPLNFRDHRRYDVMAELGRGGIGRVQHVHDRELFRDVALKEPIKPVGEARFLREALITARLEHPGIVPVYDAGRWSNGTAFYTMRLVAGRPLSELLAEAAPDQRLAFLSQLIAVADAAAYAHSRGIVHRDIKPSNVMIGEHGVTVLIDFGVAKDLTIGEKEEATQAPYRAPATSALTVAGQMLGTPAYMAPEQRVGGDVDRRADVYSLGAILFEICTGGPAKAEATTSAASAADGAGDTTTAADIAADTTTGVRRAADTTADTTINAPPAAEKTTADLRRALRGVPEDLAAIALKALSPSPDDRYPDAGAFAADLKSYQAGRLVAARRYSTWERLRRWLIHRRVLVIAAAVIVAVAIGGFVLVVQQRNHARVARGDAEGARVIADKERAVAEKERDRAIRSEAAMLLEKDPTKARDLFATRKSLAPAEALLMARAEGAGAADRIVSVHPTRIFRAWSDKELETLAFVASDGKLRKLNLSTGAVAVVDRGLPQPAIVALDGAGLTYVRRGDTSPEIIRSSNPKQPTPIEGFRPSYENPAVLTAAGLYLLDEVGRLSLFTADNRLVLVRQGVIGMAAYLNDLLVCAENGLWQIPSGNAPVRLGSCRHDGGRYSLATSNSGYIVQSSRDAVLLQHHRSRTILSIPEFSAFSLAESGLAVGVDKTDKAWYMRPIAGKPEDGPSSTSIPTALAADGDLAAWGYADGSMRVRDIDSGATWSFLGHSMPVSWLFVSKHRRRAVTVGGPEVRIWSIPRFSLKLIGRLRCSAFTMAASSDGQRVALDCSDGTVSYFNRQDSTSTPTKLHQHTNSAFGVTWRGYEACSAGWDGKVICTDTATRRTTIVGSHSRPIRSVRSARDVLVYAVEDGTVWAHVRGTAKARLLHRHKAEPYSLAISARGDVVSGAHDGSVMAYENATGKVRAAVAAHGDLVFDVQRQGDELHTSSSDGTAKSWRSDLTLKSTTTFNQPVRQLRILNHGWIASVGGTQLRLHTAQTDVEIDTGPFIRDLSLSMDGRFAGAVVSGDVVILDIQNKAVASVRLDDSSIGCAQFVDAKTMFACRSRNQEIVSISIETLPFVKFETQAMLGSTVRRRP